MKYTTEPAQRSTVAGLRIGTEGEITKVELSLDERGSMLHALYAAIGCDLVEVVRLTEHVDMWIDEEGSTEPVNRAASVVVEHIISQDGRKLVAPIHGTAVLLGIDQQTGESLDLAGVAGLTGYQLTQLQEAARAL